MEHKPGERLVPAVERVTHAIAVWIEEQLKETGLTQAEAHVLGYLAQVERCSINDLHRDFGHRRSTLTSILDRLERRNLVRRAPHPTSRRSVMVELTNEGRAQSRQVSALLDRLEAFVKAETTDGDLEGFYEVVAAIEEATRERR